MKIKEISKTFVLFLNGNPDLTKLALVKVNEDRLDIHLHGNATTPSRLLQSLESGI